MHEGFEEPFCHCGALQNWEWRKVPVHRPFLNLELRNAHRAYLCRSELPDALDVRIG
jgi:hypothetical protein